MTDTNVHLEQRREHYGEPFDSADRVVVVVHGRSQSPEWMAEFLIDRLAPSNTAFLAPAAFDHTWYPAGFMEDLAVNEPHLDWALEVVDSILVELEAQGRPRSEIVLLGFSQGACLLVEYVARNPGRYGGLAILTGGLIGPPGTSWTGASFEGTPVLLATSDVDEWVPLGRAEETRDVLISREASVTWRVYEGMEHIINDDEIALVDQLIQGTL